MKRVTGTHQDPKIWLKKSLPFIQFIILMIYFGKNEAMTTNICKKPQMNALRLTSVSRKGNLFLPFLIIILKYSMGSKRNRSHTDQKKKNQNCIYLNKSCLYTKSK